MQRRNRSFLVTSLAVLFLVAASLVPKIGQASENQDVEFEIIEFGNVSGYGKEMYAFIDTEAEWAEIWEKHTILHDPPPLYPKIDFSKFTVICAFMGRCSTTGYSISIERIWANEERIHVEITKSSPPKDFVVAHMLTYPYVFASLEKTDLDFVFNVTEEDGTIIEYFLPEFSTTMFTLTAFVALSVIIVILAHRVQKHQLRT